MSEQSEQLAEREKQLERAKRAIRHANEILTHSWTVTKAVARNPHLNVLSLRADEPESIEIRERTCSQTQDNPEGPSGARVRK